jgi:hypothetical protein
MLAEGLANSGVVINDVHDGVKQLTHGEVHRYRCYSARRLAGLDPTQAHNCPVVGARPILRT